MVDTCAAPGNKTWYCSRMAYEHNVQLEITAIERSKLRFKSMRSRLRSALGERSKTVSFINKDICDFWTVNDNLHPDFILVDPTCSGTGMSEQYKASEQHLKRLGKVQYRILSKSLGRLSETGRLVYCTCSQNKEENECVVERALHKYEAKFELEPLFLMWPHRGTTQNTSECIYTKSNLFRNVLFVACFVHKKR
ncbi:hypothetical protein ACOME3_000564 [Neoechinorhynchus agilis]